MARDFVKTKTKEKLEFKDSLFIIDKQKKI